MSELSKFASSLPYNCYEIAHPWSTSCTATWSHLFLSCFQKSGKLYASLYLFSQLLLARKFGVQDFQKTFVSAVRSSAFLSYNVFFFISLICGLSKPTKEFYLPQVCLYAGFLSSFLAIFIEAPHRRKMLSLYMFNMFSEVFMNFLVNRGVFPEVPQGRLILFMAGLAAHMYQLDESTGRDPTSKVLKYFIGSAEFENRSQKCSHSSCTSYGLEGFVKPFVYGFLGKLGLSVATNIPRILKDPGHLVQLAKSPSNVSLGLFLGGLTSTFRLARCALRHRGCEDRLGKAVSGALAGLWFLQLNNKSLALYIFWKSVETLYLKGIEQKRLPDLPMSREIIYAISTGFILFNAVVEGHHIRPSYLRFLNDVTGSALLRVNRHPVVLGYDTTSQFPDYFPTDLDLTKVSRHFIERVVIWS